MASEDRFRLSCEHACATSSPVILRCSHIRAALNLFTSVFRSASVDGTVKNLPLMSSILLKHLVRSLQSLEPQIQPLFGGLPLVCITIDPGDDEVDDPLPGEIFILTDKCRKARYTEVLVLIHRDVFAIKEWWVDHDLMVYLKRVYDTTTTHHNIIRVQIWNLREVYIYPAYFYNIKLTIVVILGYCKSWLSRVHLIRVVIFVEF